MLKWLLMIIPLGVAYYTGTYGYWAWKKGYKRGGAGVFVLAAFTLVLSVYALFFRENY